MTKVKSKRAIIREKDGEWKKLIRERDNYTCQICNLNLSNNLRNCQTHHIIPRVFKEFRWELWNGLTLCYLHHLMGKFSAHKNPLWFADWLKQTNPEIYKKAMIEIKKLNNFVI